MKKVFFAILGLLVSATSFAQTEKGFRGFVDAGYTISTSKLQVSNGYNYDEYDISNRVMGTFTGGYQFVPAFFAGVGAGVSYWHQSDNGSVAIPVFADFRYDFRTEGKFSFFADARVGYSLNDIEGFYFAPYAGVRYALTDTKGLNLGLGYEMQKVKDIDGSCSGIALKLGFEF